MILKLRNLLKYGSVLFLLTFSAQDLYAQSGAFYYHPWIKSIPDFQLGPPDIVVFKVGSKKPVQISSWAQLYDRNIYYFDNGTLTVGFTQNETIDDQLVILEDYHIKTYDAVIEKNILLDGNKIGTYTGGTGYNPLVITFNYFANRQAVEIVLGHIGYINASHNPSMAVRKVGFVLTNGYGGVSRQVLKSILLEAK